jgi:hypothetical protein
LRATDRIVRHLNLRADSEVSIRRMLPKLEDALRCASLPDTGTRVLLVRRLNLGLIAADATPQMLSRLLQARFAAAGGTWVQATDPMAERADFVYFRDALHARHTLALRLARSEPCRAWYWPLAVPEFSPAISAQANLCRIARAIAALPEAPAALPAWVARLTANGVAPVILQAIEAADVPVLLQAARLSVVTPGKAVAATSQPVAPVSGARDANLTGASPLPAVAANTALPAWWQTLARAGGFVADAAHIPTAIESRSAQAQETGVKHASPRNTRHTQLQAFAGHVPGEQTASASGEPWLPSAASNFGGLLFLLPVLQRLGYAAWAETVTEDAAESVARQMLALALRRLQAPSDDPAWLLACGAVDACQDDIKAQAPAVWSDSALAAPRGSAVTDLLATAQQPQSVARLARLWLTACRRWLRRQARIGIASLVCRPAALELNATHAEVYFQLSQTDMRVRRAALDLDPGWVGWYRRVVNFHYTEQATAFTTPPAGRISDGG